MLCYTSIKNYSIRESRKWLRTTSGPLKATKLIQIATKILMRATNSSSKATNSKNKEFT